MVNVESTVYCRTFHMTFCLESTRFDSKHIQYLGLKCLRIIHSRISIEMTLNQYIVGGLLVFVRRCLEYASILLAKEHRMHIWMMNNKLLQIINMRQ